MMAQQTDPHLTTSEQQLLEEAGAAYGLGEIHDALASRDTWGDRIQIAFTAGQRRLLLKECPVYCRTDETIVFTLAVGSLARQGGVPVPDTVSLPGGGHIFDHGDRRFLLSVFVGQPFDPTLPEQVPAMATMLGRFHRSLAEADLPGASWGIGRISAGHLRRVTGLIVAEGLPEKVGQTVLSCLDNMRRLLDVALAKMKSLGWDEMPCIPVHGDYHQFNCRFDGARVVGVVDFDNSRLEPRLYDVAYAVSFMLGMDWPAEAQTRGRWRRCRPITPELWRNWMSAYRREAPPLSPAEIRLLPYVCAAVWPEVVNDFFPTDVEDLPRSERVVECMQYFLDEAESMTAAIEK